MKVASTYKKELYVIFEAVYKWWQYLIVKRFLIRTNHKSIKQFMQKVIQTQKQQQYVCKLMGFDFEIEYKPRVSNKVAHALSRVHEEDEMMDTPFMAISWTIIRFL